jgi:hypothetical protein
MEQVRYVLGVDALGWAPNDEHDIVKEVADDMKTKMLEVAGSPEDVIGVRDHFPFQDFDEGA